MGRFPKSIMNESAQPEIFRAERGGYGRWGWIVELGHLISISSKTEEKRTPEGNVLEFFS